MTITGDGSKIIVGGQFTTIGGQPVTGLVALDPTTGGILPWATTSIVQDSGDAAGIYSLRADGNTVYGSGFVFGPGGNLEGIFSADGGTGSLNWIEDCHGDTYGVYPVGDVVYGVSHSHYCGNIGGFPQTDPWTFYRGLAFTKAATGTITPDTKGYFNWAGTRPRPC